MKKRVYGLLFLLAVIALAYNACSGQTQFGRVNGTIITNPLTPVSNELAFAICGLITRCNPQVGIDQCLTGVSTVAGAGIPLGLPSNFSTLENITQGEESGTLVGNATAGSTCYESINTMSCSSPVVQAAYSSSSANAFDGAVNLISGQTCGKILTPATQYSCSAKVFLRGAANASLSPAASESGLVYSVTPPLPAGLTLDANTGVISGTPSVVTPMTAYLVTATTPLGTTSAITVNIQTADGYLVNNLGDADDASPGDGICQTSSGTCTLRAAVDEANVDSSAKVIVVPPGTITLSLGQITVNKSMSVYGDCQKGTVVDGNSTSRVLQISGGPTTVSNLTIQHGSDSTLGGAGIFVYATSGNLAVNLNNLIVQNNVYNGGWNGGGVRIFAMGGTGFTATALISNSIFQNNQALTASNGGGVEFDTGSAGSITQSLFSGNTAQVGGGLSTDANINVSQTLFVNNSAAIYGGAFYGGAGGSFTNVTFYGNMAQRGGGLYNSGSAALNIIQSTLVNNSSTDPLHHPGAVEGPVQFLGSIIAGNHDDVGILNCFPTVISNGFNLSDNSDCALSGTGDIQNANPNLGPLQNNGGFSATLAVLPGSPAIDGDSNAASCPASDQRGVSRLADGKCDIGAFESAP